MPNKPEIVVPIGYSGAATISLNDVGTARTVRVQSENWALTEKQWRALVRSVANALKVIDTI